MNVGDVVAFRSTIQRLRVFGIAEGFPTVEGEPQVEISYINHNGVPSKTFRRIRFVKTFDQLKGYDRVLYHKFVLGVTP